LNILLVPCHPVLHLRRRADAYAASPTDRAFAKSIVGHVRGGLGMANVVPAPFRAASRSRPFADFSATAAVMNPDVKKRAISRLRCNSLGVARRPGRRADADQKT